ncbi:ubiquitin carboxyl-terminal hydrolase 14-like [Ylistrum balloti]|uniref:ubiquitin carboxyl-terminal hydrolase 14-like n=1 Tax=Ylistrum balloti TaxID=509963 RepID=UPI002905B357|nr:ubiquitin carboxyl-terminal hydrolase 14-like [Ylistrum balloti]
MPTYKVNVKWGKEKFSDVDCNTDEPPIVLKAQLFALSGVQPERQKVMMKGAVLKDDEWGKVKLKDGATLLMMGTADELPQEPVEKTVFMEDMSEEQLATALEIPSGLTNLGNTCYMNATIQCLRSIPELTDALKKYKGDITMGGVISPADSITAAMRDLCVSVEKSGSAIPPIIFLQVLHMAYPQFAEKSEHGGYAQQDANECWTEIVRCLQQKVKMPAVEGTEGGATSSASFIDKYMGIDSEVTLQCQEAENEPPTKSIEKLYQLSCFIEKEVKYMHSGLRNRLEESITKHSPALERDALYKKSSKISRLPGYLAIQFVRFYYKEKDNINAKILKDVKFPLSLDTYELCTPELQERLATARDKFKEREDRDAEKMQKAKEAGKTLPVKKKETEETEPFEFENDPGSNNSGYYELNAVLTHKGRSSSSGHYVAWVKRKGDEWFMYDDDHVTPVTSEDVLKLSGGGDWHCAYVLLYGPRVLVKQDDSEETPMES